MPPWKPLNQLSIQLATESTIHIDQTTRQLFDTIVSNLPFLNQIYMNRLALKVSSLNLNLMMRQHPHFTIWIVDSVASWMDSWFNGFQGGIKIRLLMQEM